MATLGTRNVNKFNFSFCISLTLLDYLEANDSMLMGIMMRFRTLSATNQSLVQMLIDTSDQVHLQLLFENVLWNTLLACIEMNSNLRCFET